MSDQETLSLGERLREGVVNLWNEVNNHGKVLDHHGQEIEALRARMNSLESQVHGLRSSKGKVIAANKRLQDNVADAESKLRKIEQALN